MRVHPDEENIRLSQRRGAIRSLGKNKDYEKYKCHVCKKNNPCYNCASCDSAICSNCSISNNICKTCHDAKENEKLNELQQGNLVWFKNTNGKYKKWCFCCMNK
jgi:hypothetical protein